MKDSLAEFIDTFYGYRKFIAFIAVFVTAVILRVKGYIAGNDLTSMVNTTFVAFAAGNIAEHWSTVAKQYIGSQGSKVANLAKDIVQNTGSQD